MPYSFTEKKRIRKSFAKREDVQTVPFCGDPAGIYLKHSCRRILHLQTQR